MTDATYALLKSTNDKEYLRNAVHPRASWEQGFAPNKKGHLMDSQSRRNRDNRVLGGGRHNT